MFAVGVFVYIYHTTVLRPFFRDHPGEPVPEENFWTLWCKGRLTETDKLTIRLGATPFGLTSAHLHHPPITYIYVQTACARVLCVVCVCVADWTECRTLVVRKLALRANWVAYISCDVLNFKTSLILHEFSVTTLLVP